MEKGEKGGKEFVIIGLNQALMECHLLFAPTPFLIIGLVWLLNYLVGRLF